MSRYQSRSTNWTFINENRRDNDVRRQVRVHVMREYSRQRRSKQVEKHIRDQINKLKAEEGLPRGDSVMYMPAVKKKAPSESDSPASRYSTSPMDTPPPETPLDTTWDSNDLQKQSFTSIPSIPSPQTALRTFRERSSENFPIALNDRDHALVDFWLENIPN